MGRPVIRFEISCRDSTKTADLFSRLFGWQMQAAGPPPGSILARIRALTVTPLSWAMNHITTRLFYVPLDDAHGSLEKAVALGGELLVAPVEIPTGTLSWFAA